MYSLVLLGWTVPRLFWARLIVTFGFNFQKKRNKVGEMWFIIEWLYSQLNDNCFQFRHETAIKRANNGNKLVNKRSVVYAQQGENEKLENKSQYIITMPVLIK